MKKKQNKQFANKFSKRKVVFQEHIPYSNIIILSIAICLILIVLIFVVSKRIPPEIPLYYGLTEGESQLGNKTDLVLPSVVSICVMLLNTALAYLISDDFLKKVLILSAFAVTIFTTITTLKIFFLVGNF